MTAAPSCEIVENGLREKTNYVVKVKMPHFRRATPNCYVLASLKMFKALYVYSRHCKHMTLRDVIYCCYSFTGDELDRYVEEVSYEAFIYPTKPCFTYSKLEMFEAIVALRKVIDGIYIDMSDVMMGWGIFEIGLEYAHASLVAK